MFSEICRSSGRTCGSLYGIPAILNMSKGTTSVTSSVHAFLKILWVPHLLLTASVWLSTNRKITRRAYSSTWSTVNSQIAMRYSQPTTTLESRNAFWIASMRHWMPLQKPYVGARVIRTSNLSAIPMGSLASHSCWETRTLHMEKEVRADKKRWNTSTSAGRSRAFWRTTDWCSTAHSRLVTYHTCDAITRRRRTTSHGHLLLQEPWTRKSLLSSVSATLESAKEARMLRSSASNSNDCVWRRRRPK